MDIPSGKHSQFAIENGHRNSGFTQLHSMLMFHSYVKVHQRVWDTSHRWRLIDEKIIQKSAFFSVSHVFIARRETWNRVLWSPRDLETITADLETITADLETMIWKLWFGNYNSGFGNWEQLIWKLWFGNYHLETTTADLETENSGFGNYDLETKTRDLETIIANLETMIWKLWGMIWKLGTADLETMIWKLKHVIWKL